MAGVWRGFTEKDVESFRKNEGEKIEKIPSIKKAASIQGSKEKKSAREKTLFKYRNQSSKVAENEIPENAKLLKKPAEQCRTDDDKVKENENRESGREIGLTTTTTTTTMTTTISNPVYLKVVERKAYELVDRNSGDLSRTELEIFEARQKMLEEENRKKKEMLSKVLTARKKQTTEEAKRLQRIQEELQKLDFLLSNDVGILRNKIEEASLDFAEAQKRYNRAEKEFLEARKNLLEKSEKKELLGKLLCTIIEQNELRKAQKLSDLMEKLEINENESVSSGFSFRPLKMSADFFETFPNRSKLKFDQNFPSRLEIAQKLSSRNQNLRVPRSQEERKATGKRQIEPKNSFPGMAVNVRQRFRLWCKIFTNPKMQRSSLLPSDGSQWWGPHLRLPSNPPTSSRRDSQMTSGNSSVHGDVGIEEKIVEIASTAMAAAMREADRRDDSYKKKFTPKFYYQYLLRNYYE